MKSIIIVLLCFVLSFCVFAGCEESEESEKPINDKFSEINSELPEEVSLDKFDTSTELIEKGIITILDKTDSRGCGIDDALDIFYKDDLYLYGYGSQPTVEYIIVVYADGTQQDIREAFTDGNITLEDLDRFGILYGKYPRNNSAPSE